MNFFTEWMLAVHRAIWFPLNYTLGLERPSVAMPAELAPHLSYGDRELPKFRMIKGSS
jgi:hypothetical protein